MTTFIDCVLNSPNTKLFDITHDALPNCKVEVRAERDRNGTWYVKASSASQCLRTPEAANLWSHLWSVAALHQKQMHYTLNPHDFMVATDNLMDEGLTAMAKFVHDKGDTLGPNDALGAGDELVDRRSGDDLTEADMPDHVDPDGFEGS